MLVPAGVVTVTDEEPVPDGTVVVILVLLINVKDTGVDPNITAVAPRNPLPLMVIVMPAIPVFGLIVFMTGNGGGRTGL